MGESTTLEVRVNVGCEKCRKSLGESGGGGSIAWLSAGEREKGD